MANFTAKDVTDLRSRTGAGMMDCKKALVEADGDMEKAITVLREKGLAAQAKKSGRIAAEGVVLSYVDTAKKLGVVIEVNSETDFVAKNEIFANFVKQLAQAVIDENPADVEALKGCIIPAEGKSVAEILTDMVLRIGENIQIRRFERLEGILVPYIHGEGRIGVMVKLESDIDGAKLTECGKDVAMQVAAMNPPYLNRAAVPASVIESEKNIMLAQMSEDPKMANKPEQVKAKIVDGKIDKYYTENCLLEQAFVKDGDLTVQKYVDSVAKELGGAVSVAGYVRYERGEGIQKREDNFADEVASMINK